MITQYFDKCKSIPKLAKNGMTFSVGYDYWLEILIERAMRLFVWKNTEDVPSKEIEICLMLNGTCGVTDKYKNKLSVYNGQLCGKPTQYYDEFEQYNIYSPVYSQILNVDKDVVVINNNTLRNSIYMLAHRYAMLLAHTEVTLADLLINLRQDGSVPIAGRENEKTAYEAYRNNLCNGKVGAIYDPAFLNMDFKEISNNTNTNIKDLMEVRENLLQSYYNDLGVKTAHAKKGNMIQEEVSANDSMLLLNLNDMLEQRKIGCEKVNKLYGTNWSVDISEELKYNENMEGDETYERTNNVTDVQSKSEEQ